MFSKVRWSILTSTSQINIKSFGNVDHEVVKIITRDMLYSNNIYNTDSIMKTLWGEVRMTQELTQFVVDKSRNSLSFMFLAAQSSVNCL